MRADDREPAPLGSLVLVFPALMLAAFFLVPFAILVAMSFYHRTESFYEPGFELTNYARVFAPLYLQSLYQSQILTLGFVFLAILGMFLLLFRSLKIALIGLTPNLLAAGAVLGLMGLAGIPLDIMTITIAAITVGIGVDDSIHYLHRFIAEFREHGNYHRAMQRSHAGIGSAMYYTSIVIAAGFSILVLSNFIPTIYFGLLTGFAMLFAMVANLTLLPLLLVWLQPLGKGGEGAPSAVA